MEFSPISICYKRMKTRNSDRDIWKLENWEEYIKSIDYTPPYALEKDEAVDRFILFDTKDDETTQRCLEKTLRIVLGE